MLQSSTKKHRGIQQPSKVLLVCVYDTVALEITNEAIFDRFRTFGVIARLLIFQRKEVTKLFIEFGEVEQAVQARKTLDGSKLYGNICKMNIYFSNFSNVDLKNETSQGADYSEQALFIHRYDELTRSSPEEDPQEFNDLIMQSFDASPIVRSKTDSPSFMAALQSVQNSEENEKGQSIMTTEVEKSIQSDINSILQSSSSSSVTTPGYFCSPQVRVKEAMMFGGTVLGFSYQQDMEIMQIYNIFSNFGNLASIVKKRNAFFLKFKSIEFASIASTYLSGTYILGNPILLQPVDEYLAIPYENQWSESLFFDSSFDRFTPHKSITINAPSPTIHVSSLRREACQEEMLREVFGAYGQVEKVVLLKQSLQKNMALVRFTSIEDSFKAIACLHNYLLFGRKMQISFTKSRT